MAWIKVIDYGEAEGDLAEQHRRRLAQPLYKE